MIYILHNIQHIMILIHIGILWSLVKLKKKSPEMRLIPIRSKPSCWIRNITDLVNKYWDLYDKFLMSGASMDEGSILLVGATDQANRTWYCFNWSARVFLNH